MMRPRLLITVLVLALSGANSSTAAICAAYCKSSASAGSAVVHHHEMESLPSSTSISHHTSHHGAPCAECPPASQYGLNQKTDCASLGQVQALKEGSFSLDAPKGVTQFNVADTPADALALAGGGERFIRFQASHIIRNPNPASVPLRI